MVKSTNGFLLAGASALAILASAAEANAETFAFTGGLQSFTVSVSGEYAVQVLGASGGNFPFTVSRGGFGAEVNGDIFLTAGETLTLLVGGQGASSSATHRGGGGSFVFDGATVLVVAGGGGGAGAYENVDSFGGAANPRETNGTAGMAAAGKPVRVGKAAAAARTSAAARA
jgi:Glycine rich protein